jgi:pyroglutamyl-peptidase
MTTVLLTGFEPFEQESINPSWEMLQGFDGLTLGEAQLVTLQLPCVFGQAIASLEAAVVQHRPEIVIAFGQAGGRFDISLERVAINLDDARIPDNAEQQPIDQAIDAAGAAAYFSTLPVKAIVQALGAAELPASVSHTAGTFVCNHVFYGLMAMQQRHGIARCGFVHIPFLPAQAAKRKAVPSMALADLKHAVTVIVQETLRYHQSGLADIKIIGGETH